QLDRFMFTIKVEYPSFDEEKRILSSTTRDEPAEIGKVLSAKAILNLQKLVRSVAIGDTMVDYVARLVRATRPRDPSAPDFVRKMIDYGAGPRAGQYLILGGKAMAAFENKPSVGVEHIRKVAVPVLRHRLSTNFQAQADGKTPEDIIAALLRAVKEPEPDKYPKRSR